MSFFLDVVFCDFIGKDGEVETGSNVRGKQDHERNSGHSKHICAMCRVLRFKLDFVSQIFNEVSHY